MTRSGRLGIRGLRSELSVPWNREQTDSLAQVFIEAGPRYQTIKAGPKRTGFFVWIARPI